MAHLEIYRGLPDVPSFTRAVRTRKYDAVLRMIASAVHVENHAARDRGGGGGERGEPVARRTLTCTIQRVPGVEGKEPRREGCHQLSPRFTHRIIQ